ncbi:ABC transporter ATP-binding protein [Leptolyngbya sp. FACHB-541]|uniref:ABC transporter ATP-binding protein n=1 Tax=Leptolyngbya sp. FACHB-541 TaxID=2692810 RepID=UPI001682A3C1|nr:ABC transporter ATP-binding protein [Leptolyngbya sp. FACHB-541]MBD1999892.1 ABC transporter ATP-binding protein [Leptolyngbya sp. FACHB-541]
MRDGSVVYLEGVSKIYPTAAGEIFAARDVTIDVQPGEFYSLLGSSGSGKTTTLRLIGGFEIPEYGRVWIGGEEVTEQPPYRRNVHTVFQSYALFPHLTVAENIAYPLRIAKTNRAEVAERVEESLRMFQLKGMGDRRPSQLSGGQQQRVALARALISRPKVLLLDEPLSALDAKIREEVRQELRDLQKQTNLTFIYVTHDQEEALALSDRIAVMHNGQVQQIDTPKQIYDRPTSLFVAQFIGKANFLKGTVLEANGETAAVEVSGTKIWAASPGRSPTIGDAVTLMIRPERLCLGETAKTAKADNQLSGKVASVTYVGQLVELKVETPIGLLTVTQLSSTADLSPEQSLSWNTNDCILLPG